MFKISKSLNTHIHTHEWHDFIYKISLMHFKSVKFVLSTNKTYLKRCQFELGNCPVFRTRIAKESQKPKKKNI